MKIKPAGKVEETSFLQTLRIKIGCRCMLIHNINTADGLTNGQQGTVAEVVSSGEKLQYILIKFDNANIGSIQRKKYTHLKQITDN